MQWFLWIKVLHIVAVISWMAGLLYFPRLLVYHSENVSRSEAVGIFIVMERRLMLAIMNPALVVVWITGLGLALIGGFFAEFWFLCKFVVVVGLSGFHIFLARHRKLIVAGVPLLKSRDYRIINEIPTVLMIVIVLFVVMKPF
jgi:protoporphyrinogen IX oxidase